MVHFYSLLALQFASTFAASFWEPEGSPTWDYHLLSVPTVFNEKVEVYDIDLFDTDQDTIDALHEKGKKVVCYFSAGSYENWRVDAGNFSKADLGKPLDGWEGERWLDLNSNNVRNIMKTRMKLAQTKKCDAIDPDNIDGYDNDTGFNLTEADSIEFVNFLASEGHKLGLAVGLKNGGAIVSDVVQNVQFSVQEQCVEYEECDLYWDFLDSDKPIFHVEYPKGDKSSSKNVSSSTVNKYCDYKDSRGFSSILKNMNLDDWLVQCNSTLNVTNANTTGGTASDESSISSVTSTVNRDSSSEDSGARNTVKYLGMLLPLLL